MSTGDARRCQSVTFFNLKGKQGEEENQGLEKKALKLNRLKDKSIR